MRWTLLLLVLPFYLIAQDFRDTTINIGNKSLFFDSDLFHLSPEAIRAIDSFIIEFQGTQFPEVKIEAHTDSDGSFIYNEKLSKKRVNTVRDYLIVNNVDSTHIHSTYYGESKPIKPNLNERGKQANRRAELQLWTRKKLVSLKGQITDQQHKTGISGEVQLRSKHLETLVATDSAGYFEIDVPYNEVVGLDVYAEKYFFNTEMLKVTPEIIRGIHKIELSRLEPGKVFKVDNLFFKGNRSILMPQSSETPVKIYKMLEKNTKVCVEIAGNINLPNRDSVLTEDIHFQLSVARALEIFDFLTEKGIKPERLLAKGYGNWRMLYPNATGEEEMAKNRRVEIKIMDCDTTRALKNDTIPNQAFFRTSTTLVSRTSRQ